MLKWQLSTDPLSFPDEEWKVIPSLKIFEVSNLARVRKNGKIIKKQLIKNRYFVVLCIGSKKVIRTPARLAAETFLDNKDNMPDVIHINRNNLDDSLENLKWGVRQRKGNKNNGEDHGRAILTKRAVSEIRNKRQLGYSFSELANDYSVSIGCIQGVITRNWKNVK